MHLQLQAEWDDRQRPAKQKKTTWKTSPGTQKLKKIERFGSHRKHSKIDILRNFEKISDSQLRVSPALHVAGRRTLCVGSCDPYPGA